MSKEQQIRVDEYGRIHLPESLGKQVRLSPGMTLVVERSERGEICLRVQSFSPVLVEKEGCLVARVSASEDLLDFTDKERKRRLSVLLQKAGL